MSPQKRPEVSLKKLERVLEKSSDFFPTNLCHKKIEWRRPHVFTVTLASFLYKGCPSHFYNIVNPIDSASVAIQEPSLSSFCVCLSVAKRLFAERVSSVRRRSSTFRRVFSTRRKSSAVRQSRLSWCQTSSAIVPSCRTKNIARAGWRRSLRTMCLYVSRSTIMLTRSSRSLTSH